MPFQLTFTCVKSIATLSVILAAITTDLNVKKLNYKKLVNLSEYDNQSYEANNEIIFGGGCNLTVYNLTFFNPECEVK